MSKLCLLLTACVNPDGMIFTELQNPEIRKRQYIKALQFYLKETDFPIVFVENSGTDFSLLFKNYIDSGRLEFLCFNGNNYDRSRGKGYGEANIIEYALQNSSIIAECNYVAKITGRLIIHNIQDLIPVFFIPCKRLLFCDLSRGNEPFIRSMIFCADKAVLHDLCIAVKFSVNDSKGIYFEHILYKIFVTKNVKSFPFAKIPIIEGDSASRGYRYKDLYEDILFKDILYIYHEMIKEKSHFLSIASFVVCKSLSLFGKIKIMLNRSIAK